MPHSNLHMSSSLGMRKAHSHKIKKIVLTGVPGAGKTAILELARKQFTENLVFIPESASLIFGGGFWRHETIAGRKASQIAIYYVQRELERMVEDEEQFKTAICDRGTVDGAAYWPGESDEFWEELETTRAAELERYDVVIHLRTPPLQQGYNSQNPLRTETAQQASVIDERIIQMWSGHPHLTLIDSTDDFLEKANRAIEIIRQQLTSP